MAALFAFAAAVQYNDPDPLRWMAIYGLAMLACGLALAGRLSWLPPALLGLIALIWAGTTDDRRAPEHEVTRKNDEVPENRRDDRPHRDRDVERPRRERRGS